MADKSERTEKPTAKHRKEMRDEGTVARSTELSGWASLLVTVSLLPWLGGLAANRVSAFAQDTTQAMAHPSVGTAVGLLARGLETAAMAALPILLVGGAVAVAIAVGQVGLRFTPKALRFQFSRISPKSGFSRVFSGQGLWTLGKTLLKMAVLAVVGYFILHGLMHSVLGDSTLPLPVTLSAATSTVVDLLRFIGVLALVIAGADYFFQRRTYQQKLRMTKQEVKDERRQSDGSPEVRRALRSKARRFTRMHIMAAVANADVVVTNPTHYAVAIAYDRKNDRAPASWPRAPAMSPRRSKPTHAVVGWSLWRTHPWPARCTRHARWTTSFRPSSMPRWPASWPSSTHSPRRRGPFGTST